MCCVCVEARHGFESPNDALFAPLTSVVVTVVRACVCLSLGLAWKVVCVSFSESRIQKRDRPDRPSGADLVVWH